MPLVTIQQGGNNATVTGTNAIKTDSYGSTGACKVQSNGPVTGATSTPSVTVPLGKKWVLQTATIVVSPNATAGNRQVAIKITDASSNEISHTPSTTTTPASTVLRWTFGGSIVAQAAVNSNTTSPAPFPMTLGPGYVIFGQLETGGAAGDTTTLLVNYIEYSD